MGFIKTRSAIRADQHIDREAQRHDRLVGGGAADDWNFERDHWNASGQNVRENHIAVGVVNLPPRSEEHTSELQSLMRISYAVFCLKKKTTNPNINSVNTNS